jgi:hypothetical protein
MSSISWSRIEAGEKHKKGDDAGKFRQRHLHFLTQCLKKVGQACSISDLLPAS